MEPIYRTVSSLDWVTITLLGSLVFIVLAKSVFQNRFFNFIILPFNNKYIFMYNKKERLMNWFHVFFSVFQVLNFALYAYLGKEALNGKDIQAYPYEFLLILAFLVVFLLGKIFLQLGNAYIFNSERVVSELIFKKMSYLNYSSLVMFVANVLMLYVFKDSKVIVYASIFPILLINAIGWVTIVKNYQNYILGHFFYFILYLCTLEISPILLLGSFLKD